MTNEVFEVLGLQDLVKDDIYPSVYLGSKSSFGEGRRLSSSSPIDMKKTSIFK